MMLSVENIDQFNFTDPMMEDPLFTKLDSNEQKIVELMPDVRVSQWAENDRMVVNGPNISKWSNELTPYAIEPMDTWNLPWVRKIFLCWPPQSAKTSVAFNCLMYSAVMDPGPAMYIMPDQKVSQRIARRQIIPTLKATPSTAELLSPRADDVSTLYIKFVNGMDLMLGWASSPAVMASESARYMFYDEPGKYPDFSGKESDPFSLGGVRTNFYQYTSKEMFFSTPNLDGDALDILLKTEPDENRYYHARCPFCGKLQIMEFDNIHWGGVRDHRTVMRKKLARYTCVKCGMDWDDYTRNKAVVLGCWKSDNPVERAIAIAFYLPGSWYSPFVSMSKAAAAFLKGQEDPKKLQAFRTQHETKLWKEVITESRPESELLKCKNDIPPSVVPEWAVALTAGIDVQKIGFWFVVRAWDGDLNSHLVQYGNLSIFDDVRALVFETYFKRENSEEALQIWRAGMDTGGGLTGEDVWTRTEEIYMFIREHDQGVIHAVKGASRTQFARVNPSKAIDKLPRSNKPIPGGLELRTLDTMDLKKLLQWRLTRREESTSDHGQTVPAESQRFYLHSETGVDYAKQFLAEELRKDRRGKLKWKKIRSDNHYFDCEVMAAACADNSWMPSLNMLAGHLKAQNEPKDPKPSGSQVAKSKFLS